MGEHTGRRLRSARVTVTGAVGIDGERLTGRQRSIVAALALHGDDGCTTDVLIDAVWAGEAPKAARQSLQNQITRLRRRFGPELIETDHDGYRLRVETDLDVFERRLAGLLDAAADPATIGDLEAGLAEWRGVPYDDLAEYVPAEAERNRLVDLHARAQEQLIVARMADGDHDRAASALAALVIEAPYRERRWRLLVLANHLAGRHADALASYDRAVVRFADDLRARPSAVLTSMRDRIAGGELVKLEEFEAVASTTGTVIGRPTTRTHRFERQHPDRCRRRRLSGAR
jgi:DNA-binding SARP family transcriptional activator